ADPAERRLRGDRRPARGRAGDQRGDPRRSVGGSTALSAVALLAALAVATALFTRRAHLLYRIVRLGKPTDRSGDLGRRTKAEATVVLCQRKLLQRIVPGLVHAFVFWGFIVLAPTIVMALLGAVDADWTFPWLGHQGWYFLLVDLFCVLVLVGVVSAFGIRKVQRPARFEGSHLREADVILGLIALIVTTLLGWHATQIALGLNEWPAGWSPGSGAPSGLFRDPGATGGVWTPSPASSATGRRRRRSSAPSSGSTCSRSSRSSCTSRTRSTSTSRPPGSTSGSAGHARGGGSTRSISRSRTRALCGSARGRSST